MSNCTCPACLERRNEVDHATLRELEARALVAEEREVALMKENARLHERIAELEEKFRVVAEQAECDLAQGALAERAAVVAWLRNIQQTWGDYSLSGEDIDSIEAGKHLPAPGDR